MKKIIFNLFTFFFLFGVIHLRCTKDAERDNPLDPNSGNFVNTGEISGQVLSFYAPFAPLPDVEILVEPASLLLKSDHEGRFAARNLEPGSYKISAQKTGYAGVSDSVSVTAQNNAQVQLHMDGMPFISSFLVRSARISRWFPPDDLLVLEVEATASDPDGTNDINSVRIEIPEIGFADELEVATTLGRFTRTISESRISGKNLYNILGYEIILTATDRNGVQSEMQKKQIVRIIDEIASPISPVGLERITEQRPELTWQSATPPFKFTCRLDLFRNDSGITTSVWTQSGIAGDLRNIQVANPLTTGRYIWTVAIVDEFGNWSRSKEAAFEVQ